MSSECFLEPLLIHSGTDNVRNWVPSWAPTWGERTHIFALETLLAPSWGYLAPPTRPQDPPRGHLGAILEPCWCHFGVIFLRKMCHPGPFSHLSIDGSAPSPSPLNHLPLDQLLVNFSVWCAVLSCGVGVGVGVVWCKRGGGVGRKALGYI